MSAFRPRIITAALIPIVGLAALTACGGGGGGAANVGSEPPASFTTAEWALEVNPQGEWLTSASTDGMRIDVYQVGVIEAPEASAWAYNDTEEPLFEAGDDVLVLEYVFTNTGDEQVVLSSGEVDVTINYTSLELSSVPEESYLADLVDEFGLSSDAPIDFEQDYDGLTGNWDMPIESGESVSWTDVFMYLPDGGLTLRFRVWPYDDGDFDYAVPLWDTDDIKVELP